MSCEGPERELRLNHFVMGHAETLLADVLRFSGPADAILRRTFRSQRSLGKRDRATIGELIYAVLRHLRTLQELAGEDAPPRTLLTAALTRYLRADRETLARCLSEPEAAWANEVAAASIDDLSEAVRLGLPDWLHARLVAEYGAERTVDLAHALNRPAPLDLRVNTMKATREEVLDLLQADGHEAFACTLSPVGIRLNGKPSLIGNRILMEGLAEVQDEGSQLLGYLVAPQRREMVSDFCAGAGGKTLLLGALMQSTGRLYAMDVAERRLERMKPRLRRSGLSNVVPMALRTENDIRVKRLAGKVDRVLVDAPCTGLGTLRRNPDLKWRQTPEAVEELAAKQLRILIGASRLVKPGGRLVYATCSLLRAENQEVVDEFLTEKADFTRLSAQDVLGEQNIMLECGEDFRVLPDTDDTDGFFAAVLQRDAAKSI